MLGNIILENVFILKKFVIIKRRLLFRQKSSFSILLKKNNNSIYTYKQGMLISWHQMTYLAKNYSALLQSKTFGKYVHLSILHFVKCPLLELHLSVRHLLLLMKNVDWILLYQFLMLLSHQILIVSLATVINSYFHWIG